MSVAKAETVAILGLDGYPVEVEVAIAHGLPTFTLVGLPDASIQESRERVRAAIVSCGEQWPQQRITVNLSPAHLRKAGPGFDLAIALGILAADGRVPGERLREVCLLGELSLDGSVRRVRGALASVMAAAHAGKKRIVVPRQNGGEASLVEGITVLVIDHLAQAIRFLRGRAPLEEAEVVRGDDVNESDEDLADVQGQPLAKAALELAAAGGHNLMMRGSPGCGKTMLARRLPGLLPPLSKTESLEVTRIYSVGGLLPDGSGLITKRPFRCPHQSTSTAGLIGGGSAVPQPGEVSLAHRGVLFMDEAGEFRRDALQALRAPLEEGSITIVRGQWSVTYPSRFQLIAATNPCPCGYSGDAIRVCKCFPGRLSLYEERLSGPVMDRIDLQIEMRRLGKSEMFQHEDGERSSTVRTRVIEARERQAKRLAPFGVATNAEIPTQALEEAVLLDESARRALERAVDNHSLSARGVHRLMRVARTFCDLAGDDVVSAVHVKAVERYRFDPKK